MRVTRSLKMMGTTIDLDILSPQAELQIKEVCRQLLIYNKRFSANDADSELMVINDNAGKMPVEVNEDLFDLISLGKTHSLNNPSNLNIALGPLVQSWRIGFSEAHVPSDREIKKALSKSNPENIILNDKKKIVYLVKEGMKIDLGSLAKGYVADKVIEYLKNDGIDSALINLGGNVLFTGYNKKQEDGLWRIGIQHPNKKRGENIGILTLNDKSVVTSGIYERFLQVGRDFYHHIFDKQTGYPIQTEMSSITIISDSSVVGEVWTTRLFGLPLEEVLETIETVSDIEGIICTKDNKIVISSGIRKNFQVL